MSTLRSAEEYLERFDACRERFATLAADLPSDAPVPSCPGWTVRDLVDHLGGVHGWAEAVVRGAGPDAPRPSAPGDRPLADWYRERADALADALRTTAPATPVWTFGRDPSVRFWLRRQSHETAMHLVDIEGVHGRSGVYDDVLAADAVSEVFDVMIPRMNRSTVVPLDGPLLFSTDDTDDRWLLRPTGQVGTVDHDHARESSGSGAAARIRATASDLALGLWKRPTASPWAIEGDRSIVVTFLDGTLTP